MKLLSSLKAERYQLFLLILLVSMPSLGGAEEVRLQHNGLTLNGNLVMAKGKEFKDGMVLILHGIFGHNQMEIVETSQQALLDNGRSSLAMNLSLNVDNRHGFLDCDIDHRHIQDDVLVELQAWVDYLKLRGANEIVFLGHSIGANHMLVYVQESRDPSVTHLLALAPNTTGAYSEGYVNRYGQIVDAAVNRANELIREGKGDELMDNTDFLFCPRTRVTPNSFVSYYSPAQNKRYFNFPQFLSTIEIPALITTGTADERQPHIAKHILPYVDGKKIQLRLIEGAGHFFRDFNIDEAMEFAVEFLEETK